MKPIHCSADSQLEKKTTPKIRIRGELTLCFIAAWNSFSVYLMLYSKGGISAISSVPYILSEVLPTLSLGVWTYLFQTSLIAPLVVWRLKRKERKKAGLYLFSFLIGGAFSFMMDVHALWINRLPQPLILCVLYFIVSFFSLAFGIALSNHCKMPIIPTDLFPRELSLLFGRSYKVVKTIFDISCLMITVTLSLGFLNKILGIGIGTVLCAFSMGKVIAMMGAWLDRHFTFVSFLEPDREEELVSDA